jgi:hypothetical protein
MKSNDEAGIAFAQPRSKKQREGVATKCCSTLEMSMPLVVDEIDDRVGHAYSGMPDRLYIIDRDAEVMQPERAQPHALGDVAPGQHAPDPEFLLAHRDLAAVLGGVPRQQFREGVERCRHEAALASSSGARSTSSSTPR